MSENQLSAPWRAYLLKPKTRKELAALLGIARRTLYNRLQKLNIPCRRLLDKPCLLRIYNTYGWPEEPALYHEKDTVSNAAG